ncbi:hypothetical protein ABIE67_006006 [Streptomyces sp. V4I8]|uniref:FBP domain-containing protein n=1 Tax=Streptomyces sp. V4I8 TaxID=3156469 RepID=UPI0035110A77
MDPISEQAIRNSFVNCTKGEASRMRLPVNFREIDWAVLDFLGWIDPGAPQRAYIVNPSPEKPVGIALRLPAPGSRTGAMRSSMCQVCWTSHASSGVNLFVAPRAGRAGREGNTVGLYFCADLACSLYIRGKKQPKLRLTAREETLTVEERVARTRDNLADFLAKVTAA